MLSYSISDLNQWDSNLTLWIQKELSSPSLDKFFFYLTDLHKEMYFQLLVILPLVLLWLMREKKIGIYKFLGLLVSLALIDSFCSQIIKKIVARPRPFATFVEIMQKSPASGYSFVSNHAANMFGFAMYMSFFYPRWRGIWWIIAAIVGYSRIYNGVHYLTDVLCGALIGCLISYGMTRLIDQYVLRSTRK